MVGVLLLAGLLLAVPYDGLVGKEATASARSPISTPNSSGATTSSPTSSAPCAAPSTRSKPCSGSWPRPARPTPAPGSVEEQTAATSQIEAGLGRLLAIVESYSELRSNENIRVLQTQLEGTENRIAHARRDFNGAVTSYNVATRSFPRSLIAGAFGFDRRPLVEASPRSADNPVVDLGGSTTTVP
ncbi:LemA family protein [Iamia sp. SCSIO 61187]|nr:LemA family protein [Iamia sp. SCSIO 61187]QYG94282.1 LemA family protein [Iamia sp. SCSIO 61187]